MGEGRALGGGVGMVTWYSGFQEDSSVRSYRVTR